jgi:hypothetical protein
MLRRGILLLVCLGLVYLLLPSLAGNLALAALTRTMTCTPYVPTCTAGANDASAGWRTNPEGYRGLILFLNIVRRITPDSDSLRLRQAEILVAQGDFEQAAGLIEPLSLPEYYYSDQVEVDIEHSRLLIKGTPEHAILAAYQQAAIGERSNALEALRIAIATAPELLGTPEWDLYTTLLANTEPSADTPVEYALAASAPWRGMDIIGVQLDSTPFTTNGSGPITVQLKVLSETQPPEGVAVEPNLWLVPYQGVNLAPNPGFDWGSATTPNGTLPTGYFAFYTSGGEQGVSFPTLNGNPALRIVGNSIQSISSYPLAVEPDALYLMGATVETTGRFSMGRRCFTAEGTYSLNLWIHPIRESDVRADWNLLTSAQPVAHISPADPAHPATLCQLVLESQGGESTVDNVFLIKIE